MFLWVELCVNSSQIRNYTNFYSCTPHCNRLGHETIGAERLSDPMFFHIICFDPSLWQWALMFFWLIFRFNWSSSYPWNWNCFIKFDILSRRFCFDFFCLIRIYYHRSWICLEINSKTLLLNYLFCLIQLVKFLHSILIKYMNWYFCENISIYALKLNVWKLHWKCLLFCMQFTDKFMILTS